MDQPLTNLLHAICGWGTLHYTVDLVYLNTFRRTFRVCVNFKAPISIINMFLAKWLSIFYLFSKAIINAAFAVEIAWRSKKEIRMKTNALPVVVYFNYVENKASYRGLLTKNKLRFSFMFCGRRLNSFPLKGIPISAVY